MPSSLDLESSASGDMLRVARRWAAPTAVVIAGTAAVTDPAGLPSLFALTAAVLTFAWWAVARRRIGAVLTLGVLGTVTAAQLSGRLEPAMFLLTLLVVITAAAEGSPWRVGASTALACASPVILSAVQPHDVHLAWPMWILGLLFSAAVGRGVYRQQELSGQLAQAKVRLARQTQIAQRQRIARDVHDGVGNGLAAVLLHVTGARHVLRQDPDAADEALAQAEAAGRRSLRPNSGRRWCSSATATATASRPRVLRSDSPMSRPWPRRHDRVALTS